MKIVMVASEARPFCKTGGLADVVYSLSKELVVLGEEVSIILPYYDSMFRQLPKSSLTKVVSFKTHMSWRQQIVDKVTELLKAEAADLFCSRYSSCSLI